MTLSIDRPTFSADATIAQLRRRLAALEQEHEQLRGRERAWLAREQELADFVENAIVGLHKVGPDGTILWANAADYTMLGFTRDEYVGRNIAEFHADRAQLDAILELLVAGESLSEHPAVLKCKDGSVRHVLISSNSHFENGRFAHTRCFTRDVTAAKEAQHELAEAARRKDEFLAILAHELRNPLAPIRYALSITRQPMTTDAQRSRADEVIERQVEHMSQLLDDLLDVSRIARGHVELKKKWIDLTSVIGGAIDAARPLLDRKAHALALDLPRETLRLEADPVRLTQIVSNLLTNAAKYTDPGGQIQLRAWQEGDRVSLSVRDNGIGISADMKTRLFDLFAQATPALHRSEGGLGIGLALVKAFVEKHGGTVEAKSEGCGQGSEFTVVLPIGRASHKRAPRASTQLPLAAKRLRVLVADDNVDSTQTSSMLLELWGHEVRVAHTGQEALDLAAQFMPDVALLDIGMPDMSGYEVAMALRARPEGKRITLIAVTGWADEDHKVAADCAGFDHHVVKPVDPRLLQPLLESIC